MRISKPYLREEENCTKLCAMIQWGDRKEEAWFAVEKEFSSYLTEERTDAFVVGFLTEAMKQGENIQCEGAVTKRLLYQLNHYLIPTLSKHTHRYQNIIISAPVVTDALSCAGAVGTGWTGGVDSMYTAMKHLEVEPDRHKLTHLLIANNGALESDKNQEVLEYMAKKAREGMAKDYNLTVVAIDSNLQILLEEPYLAVAAFRLPAVVLALQKLFGVFLNSAGYEFQRFSFVEENSAYYELLPLSCFETDCTVFYSACGAVTRLQKLNELAAFPPARKYLHPCIYTMQENCGTCGKCVRTISALYALEKLDAFSQVFDVKQFYEKKSWYLANILAKEESQHYGEVAALLRRKNMEIPADAVRQARIMRIASKAAGKHKEDLLRAEKRR